MKRIFAILLTLALAVGTAQAQRPNHTKKPACASPAAVERFLAPGAGAVLRSLNDSPGSTVRVAGNVVVLEADPDLLIVPNPFDLRKATIRFLPALGIRYTYTEIPYSFNAEATDTIELTDDDSVELAFQHFSFPFAGKMYSRCFVNSNGNITFDFGDVDPPDVDSLLGGPPRIAAFFGDLDPESSGTVFVKQNPDTVIISWLKVPEFFNQNQFEYGQNTFQIVLYRDGRIDLIYSDEITATQAVVGIVPGYGKSQIRFADFSRGTGRGRPAAAFVENFRDYESVNIQNVMKTLYRSQKDSYDFVTLLSNFDLTPVPGAQAFAINVQNDVRGIGNPSGRGKAIFRDTARYGSAGRLQNITFLGNIHQYPPDPARTLPDTYTSLLQILAHEVGHRWLSYVRTSRDGEASDVLLGRDGSHWSFFFDSEGSLLEGNQIAQKSGGYFVTGKPFAGYSKLDLYLMGMTPASDVPPSFVVEGADQFSPSFDFAAESAPEPNIEFKGNARPVTVDDIIAINGSRKPDSDSSQKHFNHLFVLIVKKSGPAEAEEISAVDMLRTAWESYFSAATEGKGRVLTNVQ